MNTRRSLLAALAGGAGAALAQSHFSRVANAGVKADTGPIRTECGVGALLPWAHALWAVTYNSLLMTGFDRKVLHLRTDKPAEFEVQVDFLGGEWVTYETLKTGAEGYRFHAFPSGFSAHWVRVLPKTTCTASAEFMYT